MSAPSKASILSLYTSLLRTSRSFTSYNFREYFVRRTQERFRQCQTEQDPAKVQALYDDGKRELDVLKRAAMVNRIYQGPTLVVEGDVAKRRIARDFVDGGVGTQVSN